MRPLSRLNQDNVVFRASSDPIKGTLNMLILLTVVEMLAGLLLESVLLGNFALFWKDLPKLVCPGGLTGCSTRLSVNFPRLRLPLLNRSYRASADQKEENATVKE